jgi:hypothetical protein
MNNVYNVRQAEVTTDTGANTITMQSVYLAAVDTVASYHSLFWKCSMTRSFQKYFITSLFEISDPFIWKCAKTRLFRNTLWTVCSEKTERPVCSENNDSFLPKILHDQFVNKKIIPIYFKILNDSFVPKYLMTSLFWKDRTTSLPWRW